MCDAYHTCPPCALISNILVMFFSGILLAVFCVTKRDMPDMEDIDSGGILLKSNTEAPGEQVVRTQ